MGHPGFGFYPKNSKKPHSVLALLARNPHWPKSQIPHTHTYTHTHTHAHTHKEGQLIYVQSGNCIERASKEQKVGVVGLSPEP